MVDTTNNILKQIKSVVFLGVGIIVVVAALIWGFLIQRFVDTAVTTKGIVTKLNAGGSHPQIEFTTNDGKTIEYSQNGLISGYKIGDEAIVLYDPQNTRNAVVNTFGALWGFPLLMFIMGIVFVSAGLTLQLATVN